MMAGDVRTRAIVGFLFAGLIGQVAGSSQGSKNEPVYTAADLYRRCAGSVSD